MKIEKDEWVATVSDDLCTIAMPERDARRIDKQAKKAGLSTENYIRQSLSLTLLEDS
jgi:predicted DNA binding CopG/RHH family protein